MNETPQAPVRRLSGRKPLPWPHKTFTAHIREVDYEVLKAIGAGGQRARVMRAALRLYLRLPSVVQTQLLAVANASDEAFFEVVEAIFGQSSQTSA